MTISKDVLDELLNGAENAEDLLGDQGLMKELKVRLMERMLGAELTEHLGYEPDTEPATQQSNRRNGTSRKTLKGNDGALPIDVPRDREGSFEPELIKKGQVRDGLLNKIEMAFRAYDPCFGCASHASGQTPLLVRIYNQEYQVVRTLKQG